MTHFLILVCFYSYSDKYLLRNSGVGYSKKTNHSDNETSQINVNQLGNLLEDMKHERDISFDKGKNK